MLPQGVGRASGAPGDCGSRPRERQAGTTDPAGTSGCSAVRAGELLDELDREIGA